MRTTAFPWTNWHRQALTIVAALVAMLAIGLAPAHAETALLEPEADTFVTAGEPGTSHGALPYFDVHGGASSYACGTGPSYGLLRFDLSGIPAGATITSAALELTSRAGFAFDGDPQHYALFLADDTWDEDVTWDTRPADGLQGMALPTGWLLNGLPVASSPDNLGAAGAFESAGCAPFEPTPTPRVFASSNLTARANAELHGDPAQRLSLQVTTFACGTPFAVPCQNQGTEQSYHLRYDSNDTGESTPPRLRVDYTVGPDNDVWTRALPIALDGQGDGTATGSIDAAGQARWYRFGVQPGARATVDLTGLANNYDVAVFADIAQAFRRLTSLQDLQQLSAEFAADAFSPSVFSPSVFSPSVFSPSVFSPSVFSPSVFSPSVFSPSVFSPSVFSPSVFSPSVFSPSVFSPSVFSPTVENDAAAYESAQVRSLITVSAREGTSPEHVEAETWNNTGEFYVRVSGRNGAHAPLAPFDLDVHLDAGTCTGVGPSSLPLLNTTVPSSSRRTLILASFQWMLDDGGRAGLESRLATFAQRSEIAGAIVNLATMSPRVAELHAQADARRTCPYAKNLVAEAIRDVVLAYRAQNPVQYVVLVGGDDVIPFFRYPDTAGLGPESDYVPPVLDTSASQASLRLNNVLSQDAYGATREVDLKGATLPIPDLAVGRLVETPTEINGVLDAYTTGTTAGVVPQPTSSLVTGYDFLADAGTAVRNELVAGLGTGAVNDSLITNQGVPPSTTGNPPTASWTAAQLRTQLLGRRHDLIFLAGHFSANNALAADYTSTMNATELASSNVNLANSIVFSAGCHAAYSIVNRDGVPGVTQTLDWAQAFAQRRATLIAGTGYQYGDTDFLEYNERLYAGFARALRTGTGPVAVGAALVEAKQAYLEGTSSMRGIHAKAYLEASLYGLPMLRVNMPAGRTPAPTSTSIVTSTIPAPTAPGSVLGLRTVDVPFTPTLASQSRPMVTSTGAPSVLASYLTGPSGIVTNPGEPTLPLQSSDVSVAGLVLRGVGFRGGTYTDTTGVTPLTGAPVTELNGVHAPFVSAAFFPPRLWSVNYFGGLADGPAGTRLNLTPAQYKSDAPGSLTNVLRRYTGTTLRLFYSANRQEYAADGGGVNTPALAAPPTIARVDASATGGAVTFAIRVVGDPSAGIQTAWATYTGVTPGTWESFDLTQNGTDSSLWTGTLGGLTPAQVSALEFVVQAANGVGLVGFDDNQGLYYRPGQIPPAVSTPQAPGIATTLTLLSPPTSGGYGTAPTVRALLATTTAPVQDEVVTFTLGGSTRSAVTGVDGIATVTLPLIDLPDDGYTLSAGFDGDAGLAGSSASSAFTVQRLTTSLALAVTAPTVTLGADTRTTATLTSAGVPLAQKTVAFVLTAPSRPAIVVTRVTDLFGRAVLGVVSVPPSQTALPVGGYTVTAYFGPPAPGLALPVDSTYTSSVSPARALGVTWPFTGFLPPILNPPAMLSWKAGMLLPVLFSLGGNRGLAIFASPPTSTPINCSTKAATGAAQPTSGVLVLVPGVNVYTYGWVNPQSWKNTCRQLTVPLADGTTRTAYVRFVP